jgi:site-specific recombinase XerD
MSTAALVPMPAQSLGNPAPVAEQAREYARRARAESTIRAYRTDWRDFEAWCARQPTSSLPATPEAVACYLASMADHHKASTIQRRLSAISQVHQMKGFESPTKNEVVRSVLKGIRRTIGTAPDEKAPLVAADIREMVAGLPDTLIGKRDRALLLLGFAGAFRRSELVGINVEDLTTSEEGLTVLLRRSKTDQEGQGRKIGIPSLPASDACPVRAVRAWQEAAGITTGPLFRSVACGGRLQTKRLSNNAVAEIVKHRLPAGRDAAKFAGHSLRAGFVTSAANGGASIKAIMRQTGHRSLETVMRYMRDASLFRGNALGATGL